MGAKKLVERDMWWELYTQNEKVEAIAEEWFKAAKAIKGGEKRFLFG